MTWRPILTMLLAATLILPGAGGDAMAASPGELEIAAMSWPQVRDAVAAGATTVLVPSGGIEQNGRHMVLAKHDHIVRHAARAMATALGKTLVAPVVSFVPEGDFDPPNGNMALPGTIGVRPAVYEGLLEDIATSLRLAGFRTICLVADHGQSIEPQSRVAARLSRLWKAMGVRVIAVNDFYSDELQRRAMLAEGESEASIGTHAGLLDTSELLAVHPSGVDLTALSEPWPGQVPTGATGDARRATAARGEALLQLRIDAGVRQIRRESARP